MRKKEAREKMAATLRKIGHKPVIRGGNGMPMPEPQKRLLEALGEGWKPEFTVATKMRHLGLGFPTNYKTDIAHPGLKIAIEVDGQTHYSARKLMDQKKTCFLEGLGWKVLRFSNEDVMEHLQTVLDAITYITSK